MPNVMPCLALSIVVGHMALYGTAPQPDAGAAAHLWQLLITAQLPILAWRLARWLPKNPARGSKILAFQILGLLATAAPVWWFRL